MWWAPPWVYLSGWGRGEELCPARRTVADRDLMKQGKPTGLLCQLVKRTLGACSRCWPAICIGWCD